MKIPEKAPVEKQLITPDLLVKTSGLIKKANSEYLYWDELKYQPMPEGVKPEEVWAMLKLSRLVQARKMALEDSKGNPFHYWLPDSVHRESHFIDKHTGGAILMDDPAVNSEEKQRYMIRSLVEEAISSSQIEGATTTRSIAKEMLRTGRKPGDRSEQMIYNNYLSMQIIKKHLDGPLTIGLILKIHEAMTEKTLDNPSWVGRFRTAEDENIYVSDSDGQTILHTPPQASTVPDMMQKLCDFANSDDKEEFVNPVVKGILLHFWLAYAHPFMDGNGRAARALFYWYMLKHGYWLFEYLSVSTAILSARAQYYRAFLYAEIDDNDATYFIVYNLKAIHKAIENLSAYIEEKQREKRDTVLFSAKYPALNLRQRALLASALEKPNEQYMIETHSNVHGVTYQTARTDLLRLKEMGLLSMRKERKKFIFAPVADIVEKLRT